MTQVNTKTTPIQKPPQLTTQVNTKTTPINVPGEYKNHPN